MKDWLYRRRGDVALWLMFACVVYLQWPMLKGTWYKVMGAQAPPAAVAWRTDFEAAVAEARSSGKPVLVDFSAEWCPPCKVMKHDVWPDPEVGRLVNARYVPVLVDVDRQQDLARRYGITGIPTVLVVDGAGAVTQRGAFMTRAQLCDFLGGD